LPRQRYDTYQVSKQATTARDEPDIILDFRVLKCQFGYRKVRYKGLEKNAKQQQTLFALVNLYLARQRLLAIQG